LVSQAIDFISNKQVHQFSSEPDAIA